MSQSVSRLGLQDFLPPSIPEFMNSCVQQPNLLKVYFRRIHIHNHNLIQGQAESEKERIMAGKFIIFPAYSLIFSSPISTTPSSSHFHPSLSTHYILHLFICLVVGTIRIIGLPFPFPFPSPPQLLLSPLDPLLFPLHKRKTPSMHQISVRFGS
ncbi:hypothetical protein BKA64DRAFT_199415 [Cadophora sp. MPI-SDFR-AT-0126]|nr:hypothetical protein BKA64DRAFT_199415 [Leotiomycetes sp. MPI-SDFR-AT-0126]